MKNIRIGVLLFFAFNGVSSWAAQDTEKLVFEDFPEQEGQEPETFEEPLPFETEASSTVTSDPSVMIEDISELEPDEATGLQIVDVETGEALKPLELDTVPTSTSPLALEYQAPTTAGAITFEQPAAPVAEPSAALTLYKRHSLKGLMLVLIIAGFVVSYMQQLT